MNYLKRPLTRIEKRVLQELMIDVSLFLQGTISRDELHAEWRKYTIGAKAPLGALEWDLEVLNG